MEDSAKRAMEDISFIKKAIRNSQAQFHLLSKFFILTALLDISISVFYAVTLFVTTSIEQQKAVSTFIRLFNITAYCILAVVFIMKRYKMKQSSTEITIRFMDLWGTVLFVIPVAVYIINALVGLTGLFFHLSPASDEGFIVIYVQLTIKIVSICFAVIITGMLLDNRFVGGYGLAILLFYLLSFIFPRSIEIKTILDWIPSRTATVSLVPQSIYSAVIIPFTYLMIGLTVKNKAENTDGAA